MTKILLAGKEELKEVHFYILDGRMWLRFVKKDGTYEDTFVFKGTR